MDRQAGVPPGASFWHMAPKAGWNWSMVFRILRCVSPFAQAEPRSDC